LNIVSPVLIETNGSDLGFPIEAVKAEAATRHTHKRMTEIWL
jgi:hypothetical protein